MGSICAMMDAMSAKSLKKLIAAAHEARRYAYAPYSHFHVGAALLCANGEIVAAANVENAVYGLSICAERAAVCRAVAEGRQAFVALAIAASPLAPPCGACRQFLNEFSPNLRVISVDAESGEPREWLLAELLPDAFRLGRQ
jgi:cytidine deaminase